MSNLMDELPDDIRQFPNVSVAAFYAPHSQTIHMPKTNASDMQLNIDAGNLMAIQENYSIAIHEITHWADCIGTLWGLDRLRKIYNALNSTKHDEYEWWRVADLYDTDRRDSLTDYYTTVRQSSSTHSTKRPWTYNMSIGHEFDLTGKVDKKNPILFAIFGENPGGGRIIRQPVRVDSLLEANAMWSEMKSATEIISNYPQDDREVSFSLLSRKYGNTIYHPGLTLYSAPAHIISIATGSHDATISYWLASVISFIVLNLSIKHFKKIKVPSYLLPFGKKPLAYLSLKRDVGYAYTAIVFNSPRLAECTSFSDWLDKALMNSGLPDFPTIMKDAEYDYIHSPNLSLPGAFTERFQYLKEIGLLNLQARSKYMDPGIGLDYISKKYSPLPSIFDANDDQFYMSNSHMDKSLYDPEDAYLKRIDFHDFSRNFLSSCR